MAADIVAYRLADEAAKGYVARAFDRIGQFFLVAQADAGVLTAFDAVVVIQEALQQGCVFVIDVLDTQFAEEAAFFGKERHGRSKKDIKCLRASG